MLLAVEVESPCRESDSSHVEDRATEPALYARFGIPHFWRIETDPPRITSHALGADEGCTRGATAERVRVDEPFPIDLTLAEHLPA